jgi:predicted dehydrogenase
VFGEITEFENYFDLDSPLWVLNNKNVDYVPGEGLIYGAGSHSIDQALMLFGRPASVTAFLRSLRGIESETDDTFTVILQYSGEKKNLLVTVKTTIRSPMIDQLNTFIRGMEGSFIKVSIPAVHIQRGEAVVLTFIVRVGYSRGARSCRETCYRQRLWCRS